MTRRSIELGETVVTDDGAGFVYWRDGIDHGRTYWTISPPLIAPMVAGPSYSAVTDDFGNLAPVRRRADFPRDCVAHRAMHASM